MQDFINYKWYIIGGFALIGLGLGVLGHAAISGLIFGFGAGLLVTALIIAIIKVNYKQ
jgi:hypothetical protein